MAKDKGESVEKSDIGELVRKLEDNYNNGITKHSKYVQMSMKANLDTIEAYLHSKHLSGETDSQGREKPFFNIVIAARNIWYRATDLDRRNVKIRPRSVKHTITALLASAMLQQVMERVFFGKFLNEWGLSLATYGSSVLKFLVQDGEFKPMVVPWNRLIVDPISFEDNPVIEVLELTEAQLYARKGYDKAMVEKLCEAQKARTTIEGEVKDQKDDYIKLYEVHGLLPLSYLTGKAKDEDTYVQQMHVISYVEGKEEGTYDDYTLYSGKEENPYMLTHLIEEEGQTLAIGAIQNLFESQWMENHSAKLIKDQLDLASKLIFQTSDDTFIGNNALTNILNGDILVHQDGKPLTSINNTSHDITALQNQAVMWKNLGMEINGISEAMLGVNPPARTAWRQTQAILQESYSLFEMMTENKKLALEEILRKFLLPYIKKYKLKNKEEIVAALSDQDISRVDSMYIRNQTNKIVTNHIVETVLSGGDITPEEQAALQQSVKGNLQNALASLGGDRFFAPEEVDWKTEFKDLEWDPQIVVEDETENTDEMLTTLDTTFKTLVMMNGRPMTDDERTVFNKILSAAGKISPAEIKGSKPTPAAAPNIPPQQPGTQPIASETAPAAQPGA